MRILIVEDERKISTYVKRGLEEQGYAVDAAYTGGKALDWAQSARYDVIILDIMLPETNRVLSRAQIAEHVWNYDVFNHSNVVDVYIKNLRRKIDDDLEIKLIHTVRGAGYRLSMESQDEAD